MLIFTLKKIRMEQFFQVTCAIRTSNNVAIRTSNKAWKGVYYYIACRDSFDWMNDWVLPSPWEHTH